MSFSTSYILGSLPLHHGIVSDYFYSRATRAYFHAGHRSSDYDIKWWNQRQPITAIARQCGVKVASFYWPFLCNMSSVAIDKCTAPPPRTLDLNAKPALNNQTLQHVLTATKSHDLTLVYYDEIRKAAERDGYDVLRDFSMDGQIKRLNSHLQVGERRLAVLDHKTVTELAG